MHVPRRLPLRFARILIICAAAAGSAALAVGDAIDLEGPTGPPADTGLHPSCATPPESWIWCDDFEVDRLGRYFEYQDENGSFVRQRGVGLSGSWGMRATFQEGQTEAGNLKLAIGATPQPYMRPVDDGRRRYRDIFWRLYLRLDPGWTGGGGDKLTRATSFASPDHWAQAMIAHVWSGSPPWQDVLVADPASGTEPLTGRVRTARYNDFGNLRWLGASRGATAVFGSEHVGRWVCIEARARLDDPGAANGIFEVWIDGKLEIRKTGLEWTGRYEGYGINAIFIENYWNDGSPAKQSRTFDEFVVSTERIGCAGGDAP